MNAKNEKVICEADKKFVSGPGNLKSWKEHRR